MTIWSYREHVRELSRFNIFRVMETAACIFCHGPMYAIDEETIKQHGIKPHLPNHVKKLGVVDDIALDLCPQCGWWRLDHVFDDYTEYFRWWGTFGILKEFDTGSADVPLVELRQELIRKPALRYAVSPKRLEDLVASVFRDAGYRTRVTGYSKDGGLDVIMTAVDGSTVGVQVKRWKNKVAVQQIRELVGVLVINGMTRGVFVTTSDYTAPAGDEASRAGTAGIPVELLNWERFFEVLKVDRIAGYDLRDETCPFRQAPLEHYYSKGQVPDLGEYYTRRGTLPVIRSTPTLAEPRNAGERG